MLPQAKDLDVQAFSKKLSIITLAGSYLVEHDNAPVILNRKHMPIAELLMKYPQARSPPRVRLAQEGKPASNERANCDQDFQLNIPEEAGLIYSVHGDCPV
jgi:hypothetical protein